MEDNESANIVPVTYLLRHYSNDFILCARATYLSLYL